MRSANDTAVYKKGKQLAQLLEMPVPQPIKLDLPLNNVVIQLIRN